MSRRRRAFALAGLALVLGGLAASDVAGREAALDRRLGPAVAVVVARDDLPAGRIVRASDLAVRHVPARYAPAASFSDPSQAAGLRTAAPVVHGTDLLPALLADGDPAGGATLRPGERITTLTAAGPSKLVRAGTHVDIVVRQHGVSDVALQDVEVLAATPADAAQSGAEQVHVTLRVTLRQAVFLDEAQNVAREIRVLPRAPGDHGRVP